MTLGIDPGTASTGYGLVEANGEELRLVAYGVISTLPETPMPQRLRGIHDALAELITRYQPSQLAVEELFFNRNARTALAVGQARGVVLLAAAEAGLPVGEYTPLEVKQAIVGYGRAQKAQVQRMICLLLNLAAAPQPDDATDALAVAVCHLFALRGKKLIHDPG
ncbi:MAG: crossover junction endodeoxyribonuclease RuvC [Chloroflexi bacterium]|nr:crossover junction endodeoxyribonuclease RuvC [Chloroflexota bacterium]